MKKVFVVAVLIVCAAGLFAASYENNEFQRKSRYYARLADKAFAEGEYDNAVDFAAQSEDFARQSEEFIRNALARKDAEDSMNKARTRYTWAASVHADKFFPDVYGLAGDYLRSGTEAFDNSNWADAKAYAVKVLDVLTNIREVNPLPKYYVVRPWRESKNCFWNIAAYPYVYKNPYKWSKLYEANKKKLPRPNDPNLIRPGMIIEIPSLNGEYREGTFDPAKRYDPIN